MRETDRLTNPETARSGRFAHYQDPPLCSLTVFRVECKLYQTTPELPTALIGADPAERGVAGLGPVLPLA
jgi:hypothetical protein